MTLCLLGLVEPDDVAENDAQCRIRIVSAPRCPHVDVRGRVVQRNEHHVWIRDVVRYRGQSEVAAHLCGNERQRGLRVRRYLYDIGDESVGVGQPT